MTLAIFFAPFLALIADTSDALENIPSQRMISCEAKHIKRMDVSAGDLVGSSPHHLAGENFLVDPRTGNIASSNYYFHSVSDSSRWEKRLIDDGRSPGQYLKIVFIQDSSGRDVRRGNIRLLIVQYDRPGLMGFRWIDDIWVITGVCK
jgi:hypothetical protein